LLFATSAKAYTDLYLDSFTTNNWNASSGWQSCAAYSGGRPCISNGSYFSGNGIGAGDVVFAYTTNNISDTFGITSTMRSSTGSNYVAIDMMTGPRNSEQGNKTEYVGITIIKYSSVGSQIQSYSFSENITNTSMETFAYDIGSLANTYNIGIIISGRDGGYWAGNYGAVIGSGSLYVTDTDPTAPAAPTYSSSISSAQTQDITDARNVTHSGNGIYINQVGSNNTLNVTQDGNDNLIAGGTSTTNTIVKGDITGSNNTTTMTQTGDNNAILFDITGDYNSTTIEQGGAAGSDDNRIEFNVNGDHNVLSLTQRHNNGVGTNGHYLGLDVDGNYNNILTEQKDDGDKKSFISVQGNSNDIDLLQQGTGSHYVEIAVGSDQTVDVTQDGTGNHNASISMDGYAAGLDLTQDSSTGQTYSLDQTCLNANGCGTTTLLQQ
jgi:hypothetical protein